MTYLKCLRGVKEKIVEAICEIFVNAQIHSETEFIYTCGQFYPQNNKIEFTIVDTGVGFRENVNKRFQSNLSAQKLSDGLLTIIILLKKYFRRFRTYYITRICKCQQRENANYYNDGFISSTAIKKY